MTGINNKAFKKRLEQLRDEVQRDSELTENERKPVALDQTMVGRLSRMDALQSVDAVVATNLMECIMQAGVNPYEENVLKDAGLRVYRSPAGENVPDITASLRSPWSGKGKPTAMRLFFWVQLEGPTAEHTLFTGNPIVLTGEATTSDIRSRHTAQRACVHPTAAARSRSD